MKHLLKKQIVSILLVFSLLVGMVAAMADDPTQEEPIIPTLLGDVDINGVVDIQDALLLLQFSTNQAELTLEQELRADTDGNGVVSIADALALLQYATQKISIFPGEGAFYPNTTASSTTTTQPTSPTNPTDPLPPDPPVVEEPDVDASYEPLYEEVYTLKVEAEDGQYPDTCQLVTHGERVVVGFTSKDDVYRFPLNIRQEGYYLLSYSSSGVVDEMTMTMRSDDQDLVTMDMPNTQEWSKYTTSHYDEPFYLSKGDHVISFQQNLNGLNFDWFSLTYLAEGTADQIPGERDVEATFTTEIAQVQYRLPLEVTGLQEEDEIVRYVWYKSDEFVATADLMAPTRMSIVEMKGLKAWPIVKIGNKTYCIPTAGALTTPVADPLPVVVIDTENAAEIASKEEYVNATMSITSDGETIYEGTLEIKGRGNSTWAYPKKPYRLKLSKKADLFGMGFNKHWVLLANYRDRALSRTQLAVDLAEHMGVANAGGLFVNVILNGKNVGVYTLCEHIRVGKDRVDIQDWEDEVEDETDLSSITAANGYDITGGFLIELNGYYDEISKFTTTNGVPLTVKSPEYLNTSDDLFNYCASYIQDFEDAVYAPLFVNAKGQHYSELFDVDDLVKYWVLNEFLGNLDSGRWSSTYMYKDIGGDKFHMGPIWDYDSSIGNYHGHHTDCPPDKWIAGKQGKWYTQLYRDWSFVQKLYDCYWANREYLGNMENLVKDYYVATYEEAQIDHQVWNIPTSYRYEADLIIDWLRARLEFFDTQFATVGTAYQSLNNQ